MAAPKHINSIGEIMGERFLFFTLHRGGSVYTHKVCRAMTLICGIKYYSPNEGADEMVSERRLAEDASFWAEHNGCFGPLRFFMQPPPRENDKIILHLRDPHDVLTSMFFSYCFSHPGEMPPATGYRKEVADRGIDDFVLRLATAAESPLIGDYGTGCHLWDLAGNVLNRYRQYVNHLVGKPNVLTVRYEQMVSNNEAWLRELAGVFRPQNPEEVVARLREPCGVLVQPTAEDIWAHKRHVTPGDHKAKLKPETIKELNHLFGDVLKVLGYKL